MRHPGSPLWLRATIVTIALLALIFPSLARAERSLSFEERLEAQRAIERVHYSHLIGTTKPFDETVSRSQLEKKVHLYLQQSAALMQIWGTPVTGAMLRSEVERISAATKMPDRLRELYSALGDDTVLIQECLVRPVLVDRLARARFASEGRLEAGAARDSAWDEWWARVRTDLDESVVQVAVSPDDTLPEITGDAIGPVALPASGLACGQGSGWDNGSLDNLGPGHRKNHTAVWTGTVMIAWGGSSGSSDLDTGERYDPVTDSVSPTSEANAPSPRSDHAAVWTGRWMIVWGGRDQSGTLDSGGLYDPVSDSWMATSLAGAPAARFGPTAVWTGSRMIVWGGRSSTMSSISINTGGLYDPEHDSWTATSLTNAPAAREGHTAVWTGSSMIVWGGLNQNLQTWALTNTGGLYDPATDTWAATSPMNAPTARRLHTAVWTGTRMIVWGGLDSAGGQYDPVADSWTPTSTINAPQRRVGNTAIWTGSLMVIWGGSSPALLNTGGSYEPTTDHWLPTSLAGAPQPVDRPAAVWTGTQMIVWGGAGSVLSSASSMAGRYEPDQDRWVPTLTQRPPTDRGSHTAIWTGAEMIVWGGQDTAPTNSGGRYDPALDAWRPMTVVNAPSPRYRHSAIWTGAEMIVWGGANVGLRLATGGRYDPTLDVWRPTSTVNAPAARDGYTAVWTGDQMIVWGGQDATTGSLLNTGASYDPVADFWSPTSIAGAPENRTSHAAVWTGTEMIVWGGFGLQRKLATGGRYDPSTNSWRSTSVVSAPPASGGPTAVWSGSEMIAWGGEDYQAVRLNTGGRYDPATDMWRLTSQIGAPSGRSGYSAIWTGAEMIVWGGFAQSSYLATGGHYDPMLDEWRPTSTVNAPTARTGHTAVWTGSRMIVWGGGGSSGPLDSGGRYAIEPLSDTDGDRDGLTACQGDCDDTRATVHPGAPEICDGLDDDCDGILPPEEIDRDRDGRSACMGDCNDFDPLTRIGFPERCDGRDNNCDGVVDPYERDDDGDGWRRGSYYGDGCVMVCIDPLNHHCTGDCDDHNPTVYPYAPEICGDGIINDCTLYLWRLVGSPYHLWNEQDYDGDGKTECQGDCAPLDPSVHPGATEVCDGRDNDCDHLVDEGIAPVPSTCGVGTCASTGVKTCESGHPVDSCHAVTPTPEVCNGIDDDCDGIVPANEADVDVDGFKICQGDCDDNNAAIHPGGLDIPGDPWDQDCAAGPSCNPAASWPTHGDYVSCVDNECAKLKKDGLLTGKQCDAIVAAAAHGQWGGP